MGEIIDITPRLNNKKIEEIYDYYQSFIELIGYDSVEKEVINNLDNIIFIKELNTEIQNVYLEIYDMVKESKRNLMLESTIIGNLTELFLHLRNDVSKYDTNTLINAAAYKAINKIGLEETLEIYTKRKGIK